jgi:hypothetical protein
MSRHGARPVQILTAPIRPQAPSAGTNVPIVSRVARTTVSATRAAATTASPTRRWARASLSGVHMA